MSPVRGWCWTAGASARLIDRAGIERLPAGIHAAGTGEQGWPPLALFSAGGLRRERAGG